MNDKKSGNKDPRPIDLYTADKADPVRRAQKQAKKKWSNQKWRDWLDEDDESADDAVIVPASEIEADVKSLKKP